MNNPIGLFDSGLGGISVLSECIKKLPNENYIYYGDSKNAPYGTKDKNTIVDYCITICDILVKHHCKAIIVACNTATSASINILRERYDIPIIGMEPALKVATIDKENNNIAVLATNFTLKEEKFKKLMEHYGGKNNIYKIPCPELVEIVENNQLNNLPLITDQFNKYFEKIDLNTLDSMVLGCTHFVFYKDYLNKTYPNVNIIEGNIGTANHLKDILKDNNTINNNTKKGEVTFLNSDETKLNLSKELLNYLCK